jgi:hypothetical protein
MPYALDSEGRPLCSASHSVLNDFRCTLHKHKERAGLSFMYQILARLQMDVSGVLRQPQKVRFLQGRKRFVSPSGRQISA